MLRIVALLSIPLVLAGCYASITSYSDVRAQRAAEGVQGYYYLPRTILTVEIKSAGTQSSESGKAKKPQDGEEAKPSGQGGGEAPAPVAMVDTLSLTKKTEADPVAKLLYRFDTSTFSDDILQVDTDEDGLLTAVSSDTSDRTGSIAIALADLVFAIQTGGASSLAGKSLKFIKTPIRLSFDPYNAEELMLARAALSDRGYCLLIGAVEIKEAEAIIAPALKLQLTPAEVANVRRVAEVKQLINAASSSFYDYCRSSANWRRLNVYPHVAFEDRERGIYYRRPVPYPVRIYKIADDDNALVNIARPTTVWGGNIPLFDKYDLYRVDIDRASFVQKQTTIKFANGSLQSIKVSKPSEVLAAVSIPAQIVRIGLAIPSSALKQDTANITAQTANLEAQAENIKAQTTLLKLQLQKAAGGVVATPE